MKKITFLLLIPLFVISCKKNEPDDAKTPADNGTMALEKDGVAYTVTTFNNTLVYEEIDGQDGRRLDLRATIDGGTFILTVANWDWQNPPQNGILAKKYDTNTNGDPGPNTKCDSEGYCDGALGSYLINNMIPCASEAMKDEPTGVIEITMNNTSNKTVSGNFDFKIFNPSTQEKINFKGTFTNLKYK